MQELFKEMIKNEVKPLFARHDYTKKGLNFRRAEGGLIYEFNIFKSTALPSGRSYSITDNTSSIVT